MLRLAWGTSTTLCLMVAAVAAAQEPASKPPAPANSGITGTAVVGPISPVERPGVPNTRALPGAIITVHLMRGDDEVARTTADQNGHFKIALFPGVYRIVPLPPKPDNPLPRGAPQQVRVKAGAFARVRVHYDSGIR